MPTYTINYETLDSEQEREVTFEAPTNDMAKAMFRKWFEQFEYDLFAFEPTLLTPEGEQLRVLSDEELYGCLPFPGTME